MRSMQRLEGYLVILDEGAIDLKEQDKLEALGATVVKIKQGHRIEIHPPIMFND